MRKIDEVLIKVMSKGNVLKESLASRLKKDKGLDGIIVVIGLMIIALVIMILMKDEISDFISTLVDKMTTKATNILGT